jgi:hypothetical protein
VDARELAPRSHARRGPRAIIAAIALTACYAPTPPAGAPCVVSAEASCPSGQSCVAGACCPDGSAAVDAGDSAPPVGCASADACLTSVRLGTLSGDTGHEMLTASGSRAAWLRVRVTENDATLTGRKLRVAAKLTRPAAAEFELRIYVNATTDALECATPLGTSVAICDTRVARASWGEDTFPNGADDSRDVVIEVRPISGTCVPTGLWELTLEGNAS